MVFLYELSLEPQDLEGLFYLFGIVPARHTHLEWAYLLGLPVDDYWPFLTSMFLHGGWAHIVSNMWALWIFGDNVEDRMGPLGFLVFYLLVGLSAGFVHWITNMSSTVPTVGASGAIAGMLGAYFVLLPRARIIALIPVFFWPFFFEWPAVAYLFAWFVSQLFAGTLAALGPQDVGGIAWWAHVGGFGAGMMLYRMFLLPPRLAPRRFQRDECALETAWSG